MIRLLRRGPADHSVHRLLERITGEGRAVLTRGERRGLRVGAPAAGVERGRSAVLIRSTTAR